MKVLLWMVGGADVPGGHRIQVEHTCRHLAALGVDAQVCFSESPDIETYDLVHGFGLRPEEIRRCRAVGLPVLLSTIYWRWSYVSGADRPGTLLWRAHERCRIAFSLMLASLRGRHLDKCEALVRKKQQVRIQFELADMLLPNSEAEARQIRSDLGVTTPMHVVPNAVEPSLFPKATSDERSGVLYVGRFEPHKNQLGLIRAMRKTGLNLTLVGPPHPHHQAYYRQCRREATKGVTILPAVEHERLSEAYPQAKVHVLPSWFETTGLVSLEAALCGCNIVSTSRGYASDFLGDLAWYCDPGSPRSIVDAVMAAHAAPQQTQLRQHILNHYTWEHAARATLEAYDLVLAARERGLAAGKF